MWQILLIGALIYLTLKAKQKLRHPVTAVTESYTSVPDTDVRLVNGEFSAHNRQHLPREETRGTDE